MNYTLALLVGALILMVVFQNMKQSQIPAPELLTAESGQIRSEQVSNEQPVLGMTPEYVVPEYVVPERIAAPIPMSAMPEKQIMQEQLDDNIVRAYGDFPPTDKVFFKPHGSMGDAASSDAGMMTSAQASCAHPIDNCNRFYCEGCGPSTCKAGGNYSDTDDIRRDYTELITKIRAQRNNEYPFYIMS